MGLSAVDAPTGGGTCKNNVTRAGEGISAPNRRSAHVSACVVVFRQGFHRKVDQRESLLLVCSSARMEVAKKSRR